MKKKIRLKLTIHEQTCGLWACVYRKAEMKRERKNAACLYDKNI